MSTELEDAEKIAQKPKTYSYHSFKAELEIDRIHDLERSLESKLLGPTMKTTDILEKSVSCYLALLEGIQGLRNHAEFGAVLKQWGKIWTKKDGGMDAAERMVIDKRRNKQIAELVSDVSDKEAANLSRSMVVRFLQIVTCSPEELKELL